MASVVRWWPLWVCFAHQDYRQSSLFLWACVCAKIRNAFSCRRLIFVLLRHLLLDYPDRHFRCALLNTHAHSFTLCLFLLLPNRRLYLHRLNDEKYFLFLLCVCVCVCAVPLDQNTWKVEEIQCRKFSTNKNQYENSTWLILIKSVFGGRKALSSNNNQALISDRHIHTHALNCTNNARNTIKNLF